MRKYTTKLYQDTIIVLLKSKLSFYTKNASTRILSRFIRDQSIVDEKLIDCTQVVIDQSSILILSIIILSIISFGVLPVFILITFLILWAITKRYTAASDMFYLIALREKWKVLQVLFESLEGSFVLRNFRQEDYFDEKFERSNDLFQQAWTHLANFSNRWVKVRIEFIMAMVITFGYLYCFLAKLLFGEFFTEYKWLLALTLTWVYKIVVSIRLFFSKGFEAKTYLLSVKRIAEFQQNQLESFDIYKKFHVDLSNLPIEIQNLSLKYDRKLLVLDKLNLKIPVFGKCAIVGSAGSGKHSLFSLILGLTSMGSESFPENSDSNKNLGMGSTDSQE
jgi:ATP-binding cassette subfamily C (CFTR/MRP) protein 4